MPKTNFTKVEEILAQGLEKMTMQELLELADQAASMGDSEQAQIAQERIEKARTAKERNQWVFSIKRNLAIILKQDKDFYKTMNIKKKQLDLLLDNTEHLEDKDWETIHTLYDKIAAYKEAHHKEINKEEDENIVEAERIKHINKRFNVKDKWLPLR